jgi:hypothetical protein
VVPHPVHPLQNMNDKQKLTSAILTFGKAFQTGDQSLIQFATINVNNILATLPDDWTKKEEALAENT